ncbi:Molybdate-binding periplasmic protein precursor [Rhodobacteraceae bacterium THAF1]|uniref:molybdate ABC transporter substrate-binding protein n=1 Tax=Palleronia sp. THAF1 TaxID=2587842 RepID=UPI000F3B35FF|nr:molybdate ABC transporter substrate-binding protein [Palleronia sp. THAF1]QFU07693.1 Molybdate-binding periplasmic protein precursor [Palleronia sp. THAF1]VDC23149.1 Molybdate-binding periplasmic protein precursor [Rhodobacteraceae bacterium THAF1]
MLFRLILALLIAVVPRVASADVVTVFAAASLKGALDVVAEGFAASGDDTVRPIYAGSAALARQIAAGAPGDVAILASSDWMDTLEASGDLAPDTRRDLLSNRLVVVAPVPAEPMRLEDLPKALGTGRLAMALVDAVPAGVYGRQALRTSGLWDAVAPQVAQADNVRAALALVAVGATPYGIVYATDAAAEPRVGIVATIPPDAHDPIRYPVAALAQGDSAAAQRFLDYLATPAAKDAFAAAGFEVLP